MSAQRSFDVYCCSSLTMTIQRTRIQYIIIYTARTVGIAIIIKLTKYIGVYVNRHAVWLKRFRGGGRGDVFPA